MKAFICLIVFLVGFSQIYSQSYDPFIEGLVNQTNLDSLVSFVRILSGEDNVKIGNTTVRIRNRSRNKDNNLAADYIKQKLEGYGLDTYDQVYSSNDRNIYAIQPGILSPEEQYIICAHYDAVTNYCADDNASGTAAVLEAARILSNYQLDYTLIYALWDEEETGYIGSEYYAAQAFSNNDNILGVINLDMLGWDSNNDGKMDIHTNNIANSVSLANLVSNIISLYTLSLTPAIYNPGATNSDHKSFWEVGYGAIAFYEAGDDVNPYYHTSSDRIDKFNLAYFHKLAQLAIGSISSLANVVPTPDITPPRVLQAVLVDENTVDVFYSEPVIDADVTDNYEIAGPQSITVTSAAYNNMVATLTTHDHVAGDYTITVNNVVDMAGNVIDPNFNTADYTMEGLPAVVMSYFRAAPLNGNVVTLEWETLSENGNDGWDVEQSYKNTNNFNTIGFVEGAENGVSNEPLTYFFNTSLNNYGKYYYRLKQMSSDGSFSYSENVLVNYKRTRNATISSYPNPFNPQSTIAVYIDKTQLVTVNVYNMLGQLVTTLYDGLAEEGEMQYTFNGMRLSSGAYVVVMQTESSIINHKMLLLK